MSAYDHLAALCALRSWSSHDPQPDPLTPRVRYLLDALAARHIEADVDIFPARFRRAASFVNVSVHVRAQRAASQTLLVCAHHDISNPKSENCQDNTASVAHVLELCLRLEQRPPSGHDVVLAFLDAEELVDPRNSGAGRLAQRCLDGDFGAVDSVLNLELTANGRNLWFENGGNPDSRLSARLRRTCADILHVSTPYNDSVAFRLYGLDAVCLGPLDDRNFAQLKRVGFCETWGLCHSPQDSFARSARREDMDAFTAWAEGFVLEGPS